MNFNDFIGPENSCREYKVGVIYWSREFNFTQSLNYLLTGQWIFNTCMFSTIVIYIKKYLCKYIASFLHKLSSISKGDLYIGVDDNGYIKGIPYQGIISDSQIGDIVKETVCEMLEFSNPDIQHRLMSNISIEVINVNINPIDVHFVKSKAKIDECIRCNKQKEEKINRYSSFRKMWISLIQNQQKQIHKLINEERFDFLSYCREKNILNKKSYKHRYSHLEYLCDVPNYYDMMANIKIKKFSRQRDGSIVTCTNLVNCENTDHHYTEINDVITLYTFGRYKDFCSLMYRTIKAKQPILRVDPNYPKFLLSQVSTMNPIWKANNSDINIYVIKISIRSGFLKNGETVKYYNGKKRKFEECFRIVDAANGPSTVTI